MRGKGWGHAWRVAGACMQERWPLKRTVRILLKCILVENLFTVADKNLLPMDVDRGMMMNVSETKRDTDTQIIVSPLNQNTNVPKQQQQSKLAQLQQQHLVSSDNSQLFQALNMAKSNNQSATKNTVATGDNHLSRPVSVAKDASRLSQSVSISKNNKQMYETVLVAKDGNLVLTRVPGNAGIISQNGFVTSGVKLLPTKKVVINIEPNHSKIIPSTNAV